MAYIISTNNENCLNMYYENPCIPMDFILANCMETLRRKFKKNIGMKV